VSASLPGQVARRYHESTKHSYRSVRTRGHLLDWDNKPDPFKRYEDVERIELPPDPPPLGTTALEAVGAVTATGEGEPDLDALARLLSLGAGVLRRRTYADGEVFFFRTYASAGALYPVEVYVVCGGLEDLAAGVYHFDPLGRTLTRLRDGDHRSHLVRAAGAEPAVSAAPVVLVLTGIPWRTAWKYTERGYRHLFWDAGMIVANLLALAPSAGFPARVIGGFADAEVEALLGLDTREFPLCLVTVGAGEEVQPAGGPPSPVSFRVPPLSRNEVKFPDIDRVNDAGRLADPEAVREWRSVPAPSRASEETAPEGLIRPEPAEPSPDPVETVIRRRGSARTFSRGSIPAGILADVLARATVGIPTDYEPDGSELTDVYLIANAVEGLPPGAYRFVDRAFRILREGSFRRDAGYLCLEQRLAADAAATHFLMADLDRVLEAFGDRGYRAAQLEAGIVAGRIYLGAYAYRFGATGLTFYDDDVTAFFSPDAAGKECMLVTAVGESPRLMRRD
jgi:SagB-type dehydrogenase family enzyme